MSALKKMEAAISVIANIAIVVVLAMMFFWRGSGGGAEVPAQLDDAAWRSYIADGVTLSGDPETANIVVIALLDFECPFCKTFAEEVGTEAMTHAAVTLVHWPLEMHQDAKPAAVAFECAVEQGKAVEMHDALFAGQAGLGTTPWSEYAATAAVPNLDAFAECVERPASSFPRIVRGPEIAREIGARGTPTVIVNGLKLGSPPQSYADIVAATKSN